MSLTGRPADEPLRIRSLPWSVDIDGSRREEVDSAKITDYASFQANHDGELTDLAWLYMMNRGVFMTPGREEEWTLSIAHSVEDADTYVAAFEELAHDLVA